ncbi:hypothetical protein SAMD00019534_081690 [Acytostelium subglobosum LB1]|uniref:hypothetical protein n=1 Tax=Acytostelium subglobosum LB1 TaxID=1410327 RepID=UPI000644E37C|nr:hypothetical protein SAMD00019534_081690 [Acytostelium subglobosum LB1]GAM24994.1 hypothetical protein SAMD00019534_081690 [Acytostelium subglobosum LB1]|eukprot:XP_012752083.1 hypothetical protein SAMD00019534_081690 [Acytostelium subglobosum LB1]
MEALGMSKLPTGNKVIIVYQALPLSYQKNNDEYVWSSVDRNINCLVSSIKSLKQNNHIEDYCWVGCPTTSRYTGLLNLEEDEDVCNQIKNNSMEPVIVSEKLYEDACTKFTNQFLKPMFHYDISDSTFPDGHWKAYKQFNQEFANKIAEIYKPGDIVWIHGTELMLVPRYLRMMIPNQPLIGFFFYCPFPAVEIFRCLAKRRKILQGILGADLVSFQSYSYLRYFTQSCTRILGVHGGFDGVKYRDEKSGREHLTKVSVCAQGIDPNETQRAMNSSEVQKRIVDLKERFKDKRILLSWDRSDINEATKLKLLAFERFFRENPSLIGTVVFFVISEPGGQSKVSSEVNETVARINGEFSKVGFIPVEYITRYLDFEEKCALFSIADVFISTPLRLGMNLDPHVYVSCHRDNNPGILILSEFDGAARCFGGAISINPWSKSQLSNSISEALKLSKEEIRTKHDYNLNYVLVNTCAVWGEAILNDIIACKELHCEIDPSLLDIKTLERSYRSSNKRFLVFDYDGLFSNSSVHTNTKLSNKLSVALKRLAKDARNTIYIVTSRNAETLDVLEDIPVGLGAEHGNFLKSSSGIPQDGWKNISAGIDLSWIEMVQPILEHFTERIPGSLLDIRKATISWSYIDSNLEYAGEQALELLTQLVDVSSKVPIEIIHTNRTIEIRPSGMSSGTLLKSIVNEDKEIDFLLCLGNGSTDPKLYQLLDNENDNHFAVSIGKVEAYTRYYVNSPHQVLRILNHITSPVKQSTGNPIPFLQSLQVATH